jgi:hypothetical protein
LAHPYRLELIGLASKNNLNYAAIKSIWQFINLPKFLDIHEQRLLGLLPQASLH